MEKIEKILADIETLTVIELADLVKAIEEKFGVSAAAPVGVAVAAVAGGEAAAEKSEFNVELKDAGASKINVIKVVREITGLGLKEAKELVDGAPKTVKENMPKADAEKLVEELKPLVESDSVDVVYCVPAIDITTVVEAVKGTNVQVGAQNMYFQDKGPHG